MLGALATVGVAVGAVGVGVGATGVAMRMWMAMVAALVRMVAMSMLMTWPVTRAWTRVGSLARDGVVRRESRSATGVAVDDGELGSKVAEGVGGREVVVGVAVAGAIVSVGGGVRAAICWLYWIRAAS